MKTKNVILIFILISISLGIWVFQHNIFTQSFSRQGHHDIWYCPMHPFFTSDKPGTCPICYMKLVKRLGNPKAELQEQLAEYKQSNAAVQGYATIYIPEQKQQLIGIRSVVVTKKSLVPRDAVMDTGVRKVVFVQKDERTFEPREIQTGRQTDDGYEVTSGLKEGERIAVSGTFLLDSESRLQASLEQATQTDTTKKGDQTHGQ